MGPAHRVRELAQVQKLLALAGLNSRRFVPGLNEHNPLRELRDFLDVIHPGLRPDPLAAEQNDPFAAGRGIVFSTVTAARGLQWPVVWAVGASDYILPGEIPASIGGVSGRPNVSSMCGPPGPGTSCSTATPSGAGRRRAPDHPGFWMPSPILWTTRWCPLPSPGVSWHAPLLWANPGGTGTFRSPVPPLGPEHEDGGHPVRL